MAVYDLEEQEQIAEFKAWWKAWGNSILTVVTVASLAVAGMMSWRYWNDRQALEAGELYVQLQTAAAGADLKKVQDIAAMMADRYPRTAYAHFAALAAARAAVDSGNRAEARTRLQWVIERGKDEGTRDIARLRLALVLLDDQKYDEAFAALQAPPAEAMTALFADARGDVLTAQGKRSEARAAYQLAFDKSDAKSPYRGIIQSKLDALGEAK